VHLTRDEVRVLTPSRAFALYAEAEIVAEDQVGPRRKRRLAVFDPFLSDLTIEDLG
jgi:hypothetical protein